MVNDEPIIISETASFSNAAMNSLLDVTVVELFELDAIAAFDAAPAAPRDEYAEFWDCVVAPAEAQGQPQNINADKEGEQ